MIYDLDIYNIYIVLPYKINDYLDLVDLDILYYTSTNFRDYINNYINQYNYEFKFLFCNFDYFMKNSNKLFNILSLAIIIKILDNGNLNIIRYIYDTYSHIDKYYYLFNNPSLYYSLIKNNRLDILKIIDKYNSSVSNNSYEIFITASEYNQLNIVDWMLSKDYQYNSSIYYYAIFHGLYETINWLIYKRVKWDINVIKYIKEHLGNDYLELFMTKNLKYNNYNIYYMDLY
jgi:hypothetical protein